MMMMKVFVLLACVATASAACSAPGLLAVTACQTAFTKTNNCEVQAAHAKCGLADGCWPLSVGGIDVQKACKAAVAGYAAAGEDCPKGTCDSGSMVAPSVGLIAALVAATYRLF